MSIWQATRFGNLAVYQGDVGVQQCAFSDLALHHRRIEAGCALLDQKAANLPSLLIMRPYDRNIGKRRVADPALRAVENVTIADTSGPGLNMRGIRTLKWFS